MDTRLQQLPGGFLSLDHESNIVEVNATFLKWMGFQQEQVIGKHLECLLTPASKVMFHSYFYPTIHLSGCVEELFIHLKDAEGQSKAYLCNAANVERDGVERIDCLLMPMKKRIDYEVELRTVKRQKEQAYQEQEQALKNLQQLHAQIEQKQQELLQVNAELLAISNTDKLTGIANRRLFQHEMDCYLQGAESKCFSLCLIDIDHFKKVNDTYGHAVGDVVLQKLASILANFAREQDSVARYGGEEFVLLLGETNAEQAIHITGALNERVAQSYWPECEKLTISIGIATYEAGSTEEQLLEHADQALYASKQHGRNRATHYNKMPKK